MHSTTTGLLLCAALTGCADLRFPFPEPVAGVRYFFPSPAIARVPSAPEQFTYEYARMTGSDFPLAVAAAERECKPGGKRAQIVTMGVKSQDRGVVTFECL